MIRHLFTLGWLLVSCLLSYLDTQAQPAYPADDTLKSGRFQLVMSVRRLDERDVVRLFPQFMRACPAVAFTVPCIPPVGAWDHNRLSSGFGWRLHPIQGHYKHHQGIDIAGPHQYVRAAASGRVIKAGYELGLGLHVIIDHGNSYQSIYGHLALITCVVGQQIAIGERLGVLGRTGQATGLHLHYAIRKGGRYVNPGAYLTLGLKLIAQCHSANQ